MFSVERIFSASARARPYTIIIIIIRKNTRGSGVARGRVVETTIFHLRPTFLIPISRTVSPPPATASNGRRRRWKGSFSDNARCATAASCDRTYIYIQNIRSHLTAARSPSVSRRNIAAASPPAVAPRYKPTAVSVRVRVFNKRREVGRRWVR